MTRLPPLDSAVAETRLAVRKLLSEHTHSTVLVALSGGADSLALAAAVAFEAPKRGVRAGAVIVDHGLQSGSDLVAERAAEQARALGLDPVIVHRVTVSNSDTDGPEAAARAVRYEALAASCLEIGATALLTAHTRDDQAEQVFLALARGSGTRAISAIPPQRGNIFRPFLALNRATTEAACAAQGLEFWADPHNHDPQFARVRVRERIIPVLESELGLGITANLARTAELAREDADALDDLAQTAAQLLLVPSELQTNDMTVAVAVTVTIPVMELAALATAIRNRVLRIAANRAFQAQLSREHTLMLASLVTQWHGQGPIQVPGGQVAREAGQLIFRRN